MSPNGSAPAESKAVARSAGLRYVSDEMPGITRHKRGKNHYYRDPDGAKIEDEATLERIRALAIPPAYRDVWICPDPRGHIQATGIDERGRKQYRYHERWKEVRDEAKFARMADFARALPRIREHTEKALKKPGYGREKVLATVVQLLEKTAIRVGNEEYAKQNKSYGLTTLRNRHAKVEGGQVHFRFRGKSGQWHDIDLRDRRLAAMVKKLQSLPGQSLFQYQEADGEIQHITSDDVNQYLHEIAGEEFTAKDFRTWAGTVAACVALRDVEECADESEAKKQVVEAVKQVARRLGNTPAVCRKAYIHPAVIERYLDGTLLDSLRQRARQEVERLSPEEAAVLALISRSSD